ncbi:acyltransferase domain-containing protein [Kitasatospora sp. NPDC097605]|uniref:acyltransferase domain-containing protein n=1 Tax=Kitasatospora sp. NPDC097605 TaxID=3157226 RepID=UPI003319A929
MTFRTAVQFPGLGAYAPGHLRHLAEAGSPVAGVLAEVDRAAREYGLPPASAPLLDPGGPAIEELARTPVRLHLAALASGLSLYRALAAHGRPGDVLVGHSTGELSALAAAGCLSTYDAARVLCEREIALAGGDWAGGLTVLRTGARRAAYLCGAVGGWTVQPSLFNAPRQTVVSGLADELALVEKAARALGVQATRLLVVYPHHNPVLSGAARQVAGASACYPVHEPLVRLHSPLLGRLVRTVDDVRRIIGRHLTDSVDYLGAVRELHAHHEVDTFLEVGPRPLLTQCAAECLPPDVRLVGAVPGETEGRTVLEALLTPGDREPAPFGRCGEEPVAAAPSGGAKAPAPDLSESWAGPGRSPSWSVAATGPPPTTAGEPVGGEPGGRSRTGPSPEAPGEEPEAVAPGPAVPEHDALVAELRGIFAEALGYPEEVLTDDAHLEADLGIASVKRTEILVSLLDRYHLPTPPADLRMREYNTLAKLADLMAVLAAGNAAGGPGTGAGRAA